MIDKQSCVLWDEGLVCGGVETHRRAPRLRRRKCRLAAQTAPLSCEPPLRRVSSFLEGAGPSSPSVSVISSPSGRGTRPPGSLCVPCSFTRCLSGRQWAHQAARSQGDSMRCALHGPLWRSSLIHSSPTPPCSSLTSSRQCLCSITLASLQSAHSLGTILAIPTRFTATTRYRPCGSIWSMSARSMAPLQRISSCRRPRAAEVHGAQDRLALSRHQPLEARARGAAQADRGAFRGREGRDRVPGAAYAP